MAIGLWPLFGWDLNTLEVFLSKVRAEQLEETWPRSCQRRLGAPLPGAVTFPGFLADAVQDPSPGRVSVVLGAGGVGRGSGRLELTLGLACCGLSSGVLSPV